MTPREELIESLRARLTAISRRMSAGLPMKAGGASSEIEYATTYDRLAKLGVVQRLRKRYRGK